MVWFGFISFYGTSAFVGYEMPTNVYTYILNVCMIQ